jgi:hypothetical protein
MPYLQRRKKKEGRKESTSTGLKPKISSFEFFYLALSLRD